MKLFTLLEMISMSILVSARVGGPCTNFEKCVCLTEKDCITFGGSPFSKFGNGGYPCPDDPNEIIGCHNNKC